MKKSTVIALLFLLALWFKANAQLQVIKEIFNGPYSTTVGNCSLTINGVTFFSAGDGTTGTELWRTDGTANGTFLLKDIYPGGSGSNPQEFVNYNGNLFFIATTATGSYLWKSDGTVNGTVQIGSFTARPPLVVYNSKLIFNSDYQLYISDGSQAGTVADPKQLPAVGSDDSLFPGSRRHAGSGAIAHRAPSSPGLLRAHQYSGPAQRRRAGLL